MSGHFGPSGQQGHQGSFTGSSLNQRKGQQDLPTAARESSLNVRDVTWDLPIFLEDASEIVKSLVPCMGKRLYTCDQHFSSRYQFSIALPVS